jgi:hypothetical protein
VPERTSRIFLPFFLITRRIEGAIGAEKINVQKIRIAFLKV